MTAGLEKVLALGEAAERGQATGETLEAFYAAERERPTAFGGVCAAFGLGEGGCAALAWCVARACRCELFPEPRRLAALCARETGMALPLPLDPAAGGLLRNVCCAVFGLPPRLPAGVVLTQPEERPCYHGETAVEDGERFLDACAVDETLTPAVLAMTGEAGAGKKFLLGEICRRRGCAMLTADCGRVTAAELPEIAGLAVLFGALVCLDSYRDEYAPLLQGLFSYFSVALLSCRERITAPECAALLEREAEPLSPAQRLRAMEALFPKTKRETLERAAALCGASPAALTRAAARLRAERAAGTAVEAALRQVLRRENGPALSANAQRLTADKQLDDLVLPPGQHRLLRELCAFARCRETVWRTWGFAETMPGGRGLSALFYGASGTGKTLAACAVANELGLELWRVDLSQLISKYIGETQKNLGRVFDGAKGADCILFFDEADALFSRRTDAADAQDRYANAEIAYLLQRMEQYDGIVLLATNLLQNFDEAFRRRIGMMIHFPMPDAAQRERLWRGMFPPRAPLREIDYALLAGQLELSGAGIRACALNAAQAAAARGRVIDMALLAGAAREEYRKLGKPFPAAFGQRFPQERELEE